jgi:site-specific recombinase XerD
MDSAMLDLMYDSHLHVSERCSLEFQVLNFENKFLKIMSK